VADVYRRAVTLNDNEVERFVEDMLREAALSRGVSDIHCIPEERSMDIRWRIDGELVPWRVIPGEKKELFVAQVKLSSARGADGLKRAVAAPAGLDVANKLEAQDASSVREYGSKRITLRYSAIPAINGESIVVRILDQDAQVESLESLGMAADTAIAFREALRQKNGLILITGPTGHGKSTTLAAAIPGLNARAQRVLSVEDPVEYRLRNVTQFPVTARLTWAQALRSFLRHNPDVIIVGEIRDTETAELALRLALTGHLILATVHATTAVQAIARLLDLGIPGAILASTVRLLVGQRLIRRLCSRCRQPHRRADELEADYRRELMTAQNAGLLPTTERARFHEAGGGCAECGRSGYLGRVGIFEHRAVTRPMADLLARDAGCFSAAAAEDEFGRRHAAGEAAARSLRGDGLLKAATGLADWDEILANTALAPSRLPEN
jgi:type II secretory ATPase GspE/PulE/Tfp pilus assembly ATPase PilB-like protein